MRLLLLLSVYGCVWLKTSPNSNKQEMPSVWQKNYGTIDYDGYLGEQGKLTKFWAQEAVGAPESREFINKLIAQGVKIERQDIGVIEPEINSDHASNVKNLIADKQPVGVSSTAKSTKVYTRSQTDQYLYMRKDLPEILNASIVLGGKTNEEAKFIDFADKKFIVLAAGNYIDRLPGNHERYFSRLKEKMIVVGSVDPTGFVSEFSEPQVNVSVLAPSDYFVQSRGLNGKLTSFSGTSGAAPQVTGALADIKSILPSITRDEALLLLKKTATPTSINQVSVANGAGTLNQYRALRVAKRLKDKGFLQAKPSFFSDDLLDPTIDILDDNTIFRDDLIADDSIYDFKDEAKKLASEADELTDSSVIQQRLKKLRQAFFLDPDNLNVRKSLADLYRSYGFSIQAQFYDDPAQMIELASQQKKLREHIVATAERQIKYLFSDVRSYGAVNGFDYDRHLSYSRAGRIVKGSHDVQMSKTYLELEKRLPGVAVSYINQLGTANLLKDIEISRKYAMRMAFSTCTATKPKLEYLMKLLVAHAENTYPEMLVEESVANFLKKHIDDFDVDKIKKIVESRKKERKLLDKIFGSEALKTAARIF